MARYFKQLFVGALLAACFLLVCHACLTAGFLLAAAFAALNTALYPYADLLQERVYRYFRKHGKIGRSSNGANSSNDSAVDTNGDDAGDDILSSILSFVFLIVFYYFLLTVGLRIVVWLLALPLAYFGFRRLRSAR